ncbi:hypothetical protein Q9966_003349 [Columba livia]|nr:hypothetical protein Q9966_003349 [Columba livia]
MLLRTGKPPFANGQAGTAFFGVKEKSCGLQVLKNCCRLDSWMVSVEEIVLIMQFVMWSYTGCHLQNRASDENQEQVICERCVYKEVLYVVMLAKQWIIIVTVHLKAFF